MDPSGHYLTSDALFTVDRFSSTRPDFKKVTKKHKTLNPEDIAESYDELAAKIKLVNLTQYQATDAGQYQQIVREVFNMYSKQTIQPFVSKIFTLDDINKAVKFAQGKKCIGKILIKVGSDV